MYEQYALLDAQIKSLVAQKDELKVEILKDMIERGVDSEKHMLGKFTKTMLKTWTYPERITNMADMLKAEKAKAESTREATYVESESLRFTGVTL